MIKIILDEEEKKTLTQMTTQGSTPDAVKARMVLLNAEGRSPRFIAQQLKKNPHTVRKWLKQFQDSRFDGLRRRFSPGRPNDCRLQVKAMVQSIIQNSPTEIGYSATVWTVPLLVTYFLEKCNFKVSRDTITRTLRELGFVYKRSTKRPKGRRSTITENHVAPADLLTLVRNLLEQQNCRLVALDETYFAPEPHMEQSWQKKRWPPLANNPQRRTKVRWVWLLETSSQLTLLEVHQLIQPHSF